MPSLSIFSLSLSRVSAILLLIMGMLAAHVGDNFTTERRQMFFKGKGSVANLGCHATRRAFEICAKFFFSKRDADKL